MEYVCLADSAFYIFAKSVLNWLCHDLPYGMICALRHIVFWQFKSWSVARNHDAPHQFMTQSVKSSICQISVYLSVYSIVSVGADDPTPALAKQTDKLKFDSHDEELFAQAKCAYFISCNCNLLDFVVR